MKHKVFIDGGSGTTGLQIVSRISARDDLELLSIDPALRKDAGEKAKIMNLADVVFLCLPDDAARESAALVTNENTVVIDASTAHRTDPLWAYGFPELSAAHREAIKNSKRIANPGCHATGFISVVYPLVALGILGEDARLCCYSQTGYSGGGKKMIEQYEAAERPSEFDSPRQYALTQSHKHLAEMKAVCSLEHEPVFCLAVGDYYSGMAVCVMLTGDMLKKACSRQQLENELANWYKNAALITVGGNAESGFISPTQMEKQSGMKIYVTGSDERMALVSVFDNLCKGASGAAVQNMNIALGLDELASLA